MNSSPKAALQSAVQEIGKVISGKQDAIHMILTAMLADGHVLLDDVPGVGKTTLALAICKALGLTFHRVQFTPDVLPSDLTGFSMMDKSSGDFVYHPGTLSKVNLLLADEINRGASKTQSALLEAMEEKQVSVDGETHPLERPFLVIATQNSIGTAGTHLLPYAQMDRFLVQLSLGYPDYEAQMEMLRARQDGQPLDHVSRVISKDEFLQMQREVQSVTAKEPILDYITRLTIASRTCEDLEIGISPRGALFLDRMAKARAYMEGRDYVTGTDVQEVFPDVCSHRVILKGSGKTAREVLGELLRGAPSPDHRVLNGLRKSIRP